MRIESRHRSLIPTPVETRIRALVLPETLLTLHRARTRTPYSDMTVAFAVAMDPALDLDDAQAKSLTQTLADPRKRHLSVEQILSDLIDARA